jgi:hypothetical protein
LRWGLNSLHPFITSSPHFSPPASQGGLLSSQDYRRELLCLAVWLYALKIHSLEIRD